MSQPQPQQFAGFSGGGFPSAAAPTHVRVPSHGGSAFSSASAVHLKPIEQSYFDRLFVELDPARSGFLNGQQVKNLFTASKLPKGTLAEVWKFADRQKRKVLDREDFHCALRLIAMAQNGLQLNIGAINMYSDLPLPVFEGVPMPQAQQPINPNPIQQAIPQPAIQHAQMQQPMVQSMAPQVQPPRPAAHPASPPLSMPSQSASPSAAGASEWAMSDTEKIQYLNSFTTADLDGDGFVAGKEAQSFFKLSQLDNETLKRIWRLADQDKDNKLNQDEFAVAMHLVLKVRKRMPLPEVLPEVLRIQKAPPTNSPFNAFNTPPQTKAVSFDAFQPQSNANALPIEQAPVTAAPTSGFKHDDFEVSFPGGQPSMPPSQPQQTQAQPQFPANGGSIDFTGLQMQFATPPPVNRAPSAVSPGFDSAKSQPQMQPQAQSQSRRGSMSNPANSAVQNARREVEDLAKQQNVLSRMYTDSVQSLEDHTAELEALKEKLESYKTQKESLQEKLEANSKQLDTLKSEIEQLKSEREAKREEILEIDEKVKASERELDATRKKLQQMKEEIMDTQKKAADVERSIAPIKVQSEDVETEIAIVESQLNAMRSELKSKEDLKAGQLQILQTRRDQVARLLKEKAEVQAMLQASHDQLNRIKNEAIRTKASAEGYQTSIQDMKQALAEHREIVEEERKNPSLPAQLVLPVLPPTIVAATPELAPAVAAPVAAAPVSSEPPKISSAVASIAALVDDDDFNHDDIVIKDPFASAERNLGSEVQSKPARNSISPNPAAAKRTEDAAPASTSDPFASSGFDDGNPFSDSAPFSADLKVDADAAFGSQGFDGADDPFAAATPKPQVDVASFGDDDPFASPKAKDAKKKKKEQKAAGEAEKPTESAAAEPGAKSSEAPFVPGPPPPPPPPPVPAVAAAAPAPAFEADFDDDPFASAPPLVDAAAPAPAAAPATPAPAAADAAPAATDSTPAAAAAAAGGWADFGDDPF